MASTAHTHTPADAADDWEPTYSPWRHGGWYVTNVRYPSGASGCVSRNYPDRKWRIVCDSRPFEQAPTFPNRDAAARAERDLIRAAAEPEPVAELAEPGGYGSADAYAVGDRVGVRWGWQGTESAGVVAEVTHAPDGDVVYTVNRAALGPAYVGPESMRPDTTPAPEVGQVWVCDSPAVSATVHGVQPGGLIAETDRGSVILSAPHWRLAEPGEVGEPATEPAAETAAGVFADLLAARR
ncbi:MULTISPECIES: hypothetical protein [unclassified Micromonospora]|uniref:hypothetical protein n=1 Tax=unclassified Micromonospora TaxID=2617518 RepID=UPI00331F7809